MIRVLAALAIVATGAARADCRLEIELIGIDLRQVRLSESQKLAMAPFIDDGLKRCRLGRDAEAMTYFEKARKAAGIERHDDDPDADPPPRR